LQKTCYSKPIKTGQNPQVVKHVVVHDFYGDGYLTLQGRASKSRRASLLFPAIIFGRFLAKPNSKLNACKERSDGIASLRASATVIRAFRETYHRNKK